jgi:hypothetical protein
MTYTSKYVDKATLLEWINIQRPFLSEDDIPDIFLNKAHIKVDTILVRKGEVVIPTRDDSHSFLKMACASFALAMLCKAKVIAQTSGELLRERFRDIQIDYQRTNPLFFFATGTSKSFMDLLPYETLRMYGYAYIRAYIQWRFYKRTGQKYPKGKLAFDKSSRGAYWNESYEYADVADSQYGDILGEDWDYDV